MEYTVEKAPGSFGDREVFLYYFTSQKDANVPAVLLLHGVHGRATPQETNKYGYLARVLSSSGYNVCLAETSRKRRDRENFEDREEWAAAAFLGKTFAVEVFDVCSALGCFAKKFPQTPGVLWGFSLGGLISVLIAGKKGAEIAGLSGMETPPDHSISGLIASGIGDRLSPAAEEGLALPILDSLCERSLLLSAASCALVDFALFFYGDEDESFTEASSRRIFDRLPLEEDRREFCIVKGADHAFRRVGGVPSGAALDEMLIKTRAALAGNLKNTGSLTRKEG